MTAPWTAAGAGEAAAVTTKGRTAGGRTITALGQAATAALGVEVPAGGVEL